MQIKSFGAAPEIDREINISGGGKWRIAEETPVAFLYNGRNYAVMLATPADLADFAIGFSLTERIVSGPKEIEAVEVHHGDGGVDLRIRIDATSIARLDARQQRRNLVGRAGCGVCGVENADVFFESLKKVSTDLLSVPSKALLKAAATLPFFQPLNNRTHTVHAAAWATLSGEILEAREDVGRHNALDKLIGARIGLEGADDGFIIMSSRCSYEIIEKAARAGVRAVLCVSAPTAFAVRKAREANISLFALAGDNVAVIV